MKRDHSPFWIHLNAAMLCVELECETVFDGGAVTACPRCGSSACYPISI